MQGKIERSSQRHSEIERVYRYKVASIIIWYNYPSNSVFLGCTNASLVETCDQNSGDVSFALVPP